MEQATPENYMTWLDWGMIVTYMLFVIAVGSLFAKRQTSTDRYFVAERKIPGWVAGISMFATLLSSFTFIAFPGWTYDHDWQLILRESMAPFAVIFCAILIIPIYRRAIRMSAYEYLEKRFGYIGRLYGTIGFLIGHFIKVGVVLYALSLTLSTVLGLDTKTIILILGLGTLIFTFFGGIEGVVLTEVVQGALMLFCGLLVIAFLSFKTDTSFAAFSTAWDAGKFKVIDPTFDLSRESSWVFALFGLFMFLTKYSTDQTMVQRYLLAPSVKEAVRGTMIGLACCILAWVIFFLIGSLLWGFYDLNPGRLSEAITKGDEVFPYFIGSELPMGVTGLVMAGLFAAAQSTISGDLNSIGACITSDFYCRFSKSQNARTQLLMGKMVILLSGLLMIGLAILMDLYPGGIAEFTMDVGAIVGAIIGGGLLALFLMGFFTRRVTKNGIYFGLCCSVIITFICVIFKDGKIVSIIPGFPIHLWTLPIFTNIITMVLAYLASLTLFRGAPAPIELTVHGYDLYSKLLLSVKNIFRGKSKAPKAKPPIGR
ncbi:sodium/solute symporter [Ruficoccus amylovorans]|uniref:Sodium/solute symporter n=1 Tax=Ruficoccus amylovorans TaxID=1804625 RepID=A0A842HC85_9BACT|nr:sodium/solute symporter [Ruficoccus amylovorans]MBC2593217.1 sodium/solute symporter [Ruficoccus amylovorans]